MVSVVDHTLARSKGRHGGSPLSLRLRDGLALGYGVIVASLALAVIVSAALAFSNSFQTFVERSGVNIPGADIYWDYFEGVWWAAVLGFCIVLSPVKASDKPAMLLLWLI